MAPATQLEAYEHLKRSGALAAAECAVIDTLLRTPWLTRNELDLEIGRGRPNANASRRLSGLEAKGILVRGPIRKCHVTQNNCTTWGVAAALPASLSKPAKRTTARSAIRCLSSLLRSGNAKVFPDATISAAVKVLDGFDEGRGG